MTEQMCQPWNPKTCLFTQSCVIKQSSVLSKCDKTGGLHIFSMKLPHYYVLPILKLCIVDCSLNIAEMISSRPGLSLGLCWHPNDVVLMTDPILSGIYPNLRAIFGMINIW